MVFLTATLLAIIGGMQQDPPAAPAVIDPQVRTSSSVASPDLSATVTIDYDRYGVPTVSADSRDDAYFAEGFLHAQNRFSQMDVSRRASAGELSALVGPQLLPRDREARGFRMRAVARQVVENMSEAERAAIERYAAGVNAGLDDLRMPPPEYGILGAEPAPWSAEDTILVMFTFTMLLDNSASLDAFNAPIFEALPVELREYLYWPFSRHDAPIHALEEAGRRSDRPISLPRIPPREVISFRDLPAVPPTIEPSRDDEHHEDDPPPSREGASKGSNNWVIGASRTRDGRAIMANDPHLALTLPAAWYRIRLLWPEHDLVGLSVPGIPGIIIGSNGSVAWGFTNATGDFQDLIAIEVDPDDPSRYRTVDGWEPFGEVIESIEVAGGQPEELKLRTTRWGIVNGSYLDASGTRRDAVVDWFALHPELINLKVFELEDAETTEQALRILSEWMGPPQNAVVADSRGDIGYTLTGFLPSRPEHDGRAPYGLWDGSEQFTAREQGVRPMVFAPKEDFIQTANNRTAGPLLAKQIGYAWANPARAKRIQQVLSRSRDADERSMLELQMDPTTLGLEPWRKIVLHVIPEDEEDPALAEARKAVLEWNSRADTDQVGITLLEDLRSRMLDEMTIAVADWARQQGLGDFPRAYRNEEPYLRAIEDELPNWLPPGEAEDWHAWARQHIRDSIEEGSLAPWGERNAVTISSPFASMAPEPLARMLKIEVGPQSGYWNAPKVLGRGFGASARIIVSPGHEEDGILLLPGGQSGNPFSPHYRSLTPSWVAGDPLPLLPGDSVARFTLEPQAEADTKD